MRSKYNCQSASRTTKKQKTKLNQKQTNKRIYTKIYDNEEEGRH